jgi:hypothetical protein
LYDIQRIACGREYDKAFRQYLWGRHFTVRTDHSSLRWLNNYEDADGMLARWLASLQTYDFSIIHRQGKLHSNADGLSRCTKCKNEACPGFPMVSSSDDSDIDYPRVTVKDCRVETGRQSDTLDIRCTRTVASSVDVPSRFLWPRQRQFLRRITKKLDDSKWLDGYISTDIAQAQTLDPGVGIVHTWVTSGQKPETKVLARYSDETRALVARWNQLSVTDDILYRSAP